MATQTVLVLLLGKNKGVVEVTSENLIIAWTWLHALRVGVEPANQQELGVFAATELTRYYEILKTKPSARPILGLI
jgi:hypothetical protein